MHGKRWGAAVLAVVGVLGLSACGSESSTHEEAEPAKVEEIAGSDLSRITLTPEAAKRLDVKTASVRRANGATVIPYAAILYEPDGKTWTYTSPKPLTFVRAPVVVERIAGDVAILSSGPAPGTKVATVAVAELFGAETGIDGSGH